MDRNNYNRNGGNHGGRSNRGRGRAFTDSGNTGNGSGYPRGSGTQSFPQQNQQYGSYAGGGRGPAGAGYYPRGSGTQNFPQQNQQYFSNAGGGRGPAGAGYYPRGSGTGGNGNFQQQQPEQYGRGGGGRSGAGGSGSGGGRGHQSYQQSVDRVQERTPVGSVGSTSQSITQRVSDLKFEDLDRTNGPIRRPDRGGTLALATVPLLVNHFPVKFDPSKSILRYDVDVKQEGNQEGSSSNGFLANNVGEPSSPKVTTLTSNIVIEKPEDYYLEFMIKAIKDICTYKQEIGLTMIASIVSIQYEEGWYYFACRKCSKKVKHNDAGDGNAPFHCTECGDVSDVYGQVRVVIRVQDDTGSSFVLFERHLTSLLHRSHTYFMDKINKDEGRQIFPDDLMTLMNRKCVFKIQVSQFNLDNSYLPYTVHKLTDDEHVIDAILKRSTNGTPDNPKKDKEIVVIDDIINVDDLDAKKPSTNGVLVTQRVSDVKQEGNQEGPSSRTVKKAIPKSDLRLIQEKLCSEYRNEFPLLQTAYDGEKNIYSAITLKSGTYTVELFGRSYSCTIKYGNELHLSKLQDFLNGNALQIPRDVLQALDVVTKANLFREKVYVGRGMYPRVHRREDDLRCGVAAYRGSQQSLKVTSNGLVMCTDYSAILLRKRMPVIDFLKEYIREIQEVNDIPKVRNKVMRALKGLRVSVTHRRTNQKYIVSGLTDKLTRDISFEMEDLEGNEEPEVVMLTDYYREKWGKEIVHKSIPCLQLGNSKKPNYVPMEFCFLAEDKRYPKEQLGGEAARQLKDLCLLAPDNRMNEICRMVGEEFGTGRSGAEVIKNFDLGVGMDMTEVNGRVLAPPRLKLGSLSGRPNTVTVDKFKCHYNLLQGKTLASGKSAERWALIDFSNGDRWNWLNANSFIPKLMNRCRSIGVKMEEPLLVYPTDTRELSDVNTVRGLLTWVVEECKKKDKGRLQLIVCVMAYKHDGYKSIKWVSETEIGVMTQCCLSPNANKGSDQFLANLGMKINAKLGGSNVELIEKFSRFSGEEHCMFIGAKHSAASNKFSPSVAAIVGSMNWPAASKYSARVYPQKHRKGEIINFGKSCLDLVNTYAKLNGVKPNKIVVFRNGVSDAQFYMVLNKEMVDMKKALYTEDYRPFVTFVVAQKRHTTRLFLNNGKDVGKLPPGTVVDTKIVHPVEFDFYLCSHFGGIGNIKPTHYSVIWDEIGFSSDEMQKLIYHLCFIFARCTKPVSLVPPVYYADLVAYRGRMFQEVVMETQSGSETSSFDQFFFNLENNLKDSMFFI